MGAGPTAPGGFMMLDAMFTGPAAWFSTIALLGTLIFVLRLALLLFGAHGLHLGDHALGHGDVHDHHGDSGEAFRLLTLEGIMAFFMGLGWGGLAAFRADFGLGWAVFIGFGCGLAMLWFQGLLLQSMYRLQASGNIALKDALGAHGVVYITIPGGTRGKGQVTLVVKERQRQFNAITAGDDLPSKTRVRVIGINDDNTVTVQKAPE
jgi:hypothetical protein